MTRYSFEYGTKTNIEKKTAIAREACKLLKNGDVIFCDTGTTTQCFCAELVCRIKREGLNVKLYTNSLANLELLSPYMPVTLIGGEYRPNRKDFCGYLTDQALTGLYFSKSFVGADGCVHGRQFTTTDFDTARMNQIAMRNTDQNIMLVDSSKFSVSAHVAYAPLEMLHTIVTDTGIRPGDARAAQKLARPGDLRRRIQAVCGPKHKRVSPSERNRREERNLVMKPVIRTPYFEVGTKNYVYGDSSWSTPGRRTRQRRSTTLTCCLSARHWKSAAWRKTRSTCSYWRRIWTRSAPGRGCADILPEGLKAAGAVGVMINHCEKPMSLPQMKKTIDRARELDFLVFAWRRYAG